MRRIGLYLILFFQVLLIISLVKGAYQTLKSRERIAQLEERKAELLAEKERLEGKLAEVQSPGYLEKVARDELQLSKPGETVVIVPEANLQVSGEEGEGQKEAERPNYVKWWEVIAGQN